VGQLPEISLGVEAVRRSVVNPAVSNAVAQSGGVSARVDTVDGELIVSMPKQSGVNTSLVRQAEWSQHQQARDQVGRAGQGQRRGVGRECVVLVCILCMYCLDMLGVVME
jgi:hypothetical protein